MMGSYSAMRSTRARQKSGTLRRIASVYLNSMHSNTHVRKNSRRFRLRFGQYYPATAVATDPCSCSEKTKCLLLFSVRVLRKPHARVRDYGDEDIHHDDDDNDHEPREEHARGLGHVRAVVKLKATKHPERIALITLSKQRWKKSHPTATGLKGQAVQLQDCSCNDGKKKIGKRKEHTQPSFQQQQGTAGRPFLASPMEYVQMSQKELVKECHSSLASGSLTKRMWYLHARTMRHRESRARSQNAPWEKHHDARRQRAQVTAGVHPT